MSRSEFYAKALSEYVDRHGDGQVTAKLNEVYADADSSRDTVIETLLFRSLPREDWS